MMARQSIGNETIVEDGRKLPFSKEDVFSELRELILREGARIDLMRGPDATRAFLGFDYEANDQEEKYFPEYLDQIKLEDFEIARNFDVAYDYAFQVGQWSRFDEVVECRLRGVAHGFAAWGVEGGESPYHRDGSVCRHVVDLATARHHLTHFDISPTIEQLALLANMTEAAVRNSLSQEGIKPEGKPAKVENDVAWEWLKKRRGFIPNRIRPERVESAKERTERIFDRTNFGNAIRHAAMESGLHGSDGELQAAIAARSGIDEAFVASLLDEAPELELAKCCAVARALQLYIPRFSSLAIQLALEKAELPPPNRGS